VIPFGQLSWSGLVQDLVDAGSNSAALLGGYFVLLAARYFLALFVESLSKRG
jgi:hypothetical protein